MTPCEDVVRALIWDRIGVGLSPPPAHDRKRLGMWASSKSNVAFFFPPPLSPPLSFLFTCYQQNGFLLGSANLSWAAAPYPVAVFRGTGRYLVLQATQRSLGST